MSLSALVLRKGAGCNGGKITTMIVHSGWQFLSRFAAALVAALAFSSGAVLAETGSATDFKALAQALRAGGLNILVRHGATNSNQADTDPFHLADISKQRNLSEKGKELARAYGTAIRLAGVPVGEVYTSEFNRGYETAVLAGFTDIEKTADLSEGGLVVTPDENNRRAKALLALLSREPAKGKNNFLITHKPNILDALGKDWFDVKEGESSVFKPEGGKYKLVARVQMADWPSIAAAK
jgi:phosphohistidine phosphatase SixA